MPDLRPLHPVSREHLDVLSDQIGIMQHAVGRRPDPDHGYCTDDVARALQVDLLHQRQLGWDVVADSAARNLRFIDEAFDPPTGRFRNFRRIDGTWLDAIASEDSQGRAMLALGETMVAAPDEAIREHAASLFSQALPLAQGLGAIRAQASVMLGCDASLRASPSGSTLVAYRTLAGRLGSAFESRRGSAWPWPEPLITYENALPARALVAAGVWFESRALIDTGLGILDWLVSAQTSVRGHFSPVGNGWWSSAGQKSQFDQQPIEATATLLAAESAFLLTGDANYRTAMERTYGWFLGDNDLGVTVADPGRGASNDGITPKGVNSNQGAESTLMWLIALEHVRAMRVGAPTVVRQSDSVPAVSIS